jgi:ribosomal protein L13E
MTTVKVYWDREFEEIRIRNEKRDILATIFSVPQNMGSGVVRKYEIVVHGEVYPITFEL